MGLEEAPITTSGIGATRQRESVPQAGAAFSTTRIAALSLPVTDRDSGDVSSPEAHPANTDTARAMTVATTVTGRHEVMTAPNCGRERGTATVVPWEVGGKREAVISGFGGVTHFDVTSENGRIVLTPVRFNRADVVRAKLAEVGITESDVADAVKWARRGE